jgi:hypothetical protein
MRLGGDERFVAGKHIHFSAGGLVHPKPTWKEGREKK